MNPPRATRTPAYDAAWRDPAHVIGLWESPAPPDPRLFAHRTRGPWWDLLEAAGVTLLITREYEHLVIALHARHGRPSVSYLPVPHPSGIAVDLAERTVYLASTRNPNQVIALRPTTGAVARSDVAVADPRTGVLTPVRSWFFPGCLYIHDLARVGDALHAASTGMNAVVRLDPAGGQTPVWWPACMDRPASTPRFDKNFIQLNSIAAGPDLVRSYFGASAARMSSRRPGHRHFPVDGRGVIFHGGTREVVCSGLTRPHSTRLRRGRVWVNNSGYGQVGVMSDAAFLPVAGLCGWTRGLCFHGPLAFVGTSRVLPGYHAYAPGLDPRRSRCGVHAVDTRTGAVLASLFWPHGTQIFAVEALPRRWASVLPFARGAGDRLRPKARFFYTFKTNHQGETA